MDPLTALGLAANVAQFVDFGASIFRDSKEIFHRGSTVSIRHLDELASDIKRVSSSLTGKCADLSSKPLSKEEEVPFSALFLLFSPATCH